MADKTENTAGKPDTIAQALNAGRDVIEKARRLLPSIPKGPQRPAPATLGDAQALVQERQQQALQHKEPKPKNKSQAAPAPEQAFPGSRIGGANDSSAYWTLVEEYFRDVTRQDIVNLLSFCIDPDDDDALLVPQLGAPKENAEEPQPQLHLPASAPSMKAFGGYSRAAGVVAATAAADEGDDGQERKRSSRLAGKAMRRDSADRYDDYSYDGSSSALQQLPSPYCLLEQIPAADLLMMTHVSMQLQQLSTADVAAAVGMEERSLESLLQRALQPAVTNHAGLAGYGGQHTPSGSNSKHQKQRDAAAAAAASSWAVMSTGAGGPLLTAKQRQALVAWLQNQCAAPEVWHNMRGPVAAPWVPPPEQPAAAESGPDAAAAVGAGPSEQQQQQADAAASQQGAEQPTSQQQQLQQQAAALAEQTAADATQPAAAAGNVANLSSAVGQPMAGGGTAAAAAASNVDPIEAAAAAGASEAAGAAAGSATPAAQSSDVAAAASPAGFPEPQLDLPPQEIAAVAAAVVAAASAPPPAAADAPDENELRLAADKAKRDEMHAAERARRRAEARLELHPYIRTLLARPLPPHIADPGWDIQELVEDEPDDAAAASAAAADTAAAAGDAAAGTAGASASKATKGAKAAAAAAKRAGSVSTTAAAADSAAGMGDDEGSAADVSPAVGGASSSLPPSSAGRGSKASAGRGRGRGRGRWGGRKSGAGRGSKSGAAGRPGGAGKAAGGGAGAAAGGGAAAGSGAADGTEAKERRAPCAAAQAVQAIIAAAPPEGSLEQQWQLLDESADVLSLAPDDEVLAELLALQGELLQQAAINRARLGAVLQAALDDMPRQAEAAAERARWEADITNYAIAVREARKEAKRLRREAERRAAAEQLAAAEPLSPRNTAARAAARIREGRSSLRGGEWLLGSETEDERAEAREGSPAVPKAGHGSQADAGETAEVLADTLASRDTDDALCAVCGEGHSEAPNQIIFCERCDLPVHQLCYCVDVIPDGEWLCWPCIEYEEQQRRVGVPQADIRPPRWQLGAGGGGQPLPGGSRGVQCVLCPVSCGAFKQAKDGSRRWVHMVCALWHQETRVDQVNAAEAVSGLDRLEGRLAAPSTHVCQVCRRTSGVPVRCAFGHCSSYFHPLCARARGYHLAIRPGVKQGLTYRAYCAAHSEAQRQKDREAVERAAAAMFAGPPAKPARRGRPPVGSLAEDYYTDTLLAEHEAAAAAAVVVPPPRPEVDPAVLQAISGKEQHYWALQGVRLELERARLLADQVRRREKLKLALAKSSIEVHEARLEDPVEGLTELLADIAAHEPVTAAAQATAAVIGLDFSVPYDAAAAAAAAVTPQAAVAATAQDELQQQLPAVAGLQNALVAAQQLITADAAAAAAQDAAAEPDPAAAAAAVGEAAADASMEQPVTGDGAAPAAAMAPAAATPIEATAAAAASPSAVGTAEAPPAAADGVTGPSTKQQVASSSSARPPKLQLTGSKRKQPPAATEAAAAVDAARSCVQAVGSAGSPLAAAAAAPMAVSPSSDQQQQQQPQQQPKPVPIAEVPIVLTSTAKRRRTAGPGGPGRRGGTGVRSPTAAAAAAGTGSITDGTPSASISSAVIDSNVAETAVADYTDKGVSEAGAAAVQQQSAAGATEDPAAAQQQTASRSRAAGSRKRARPESDDTEPAVADTAAAVHAHDAMRGDPTAATPPADDEQQKQQQVGQEPNTPATAATAAAAPAVENGVDLQRQNNADGSDSIAEPAAAKAVVAGKDQQQVIATAGAGAAAAAAAEQEPGKQQQEAADHTDEQQQQQQQDKQHDQSGKPPRKSEQRKRSTATELRLLQADLAQSSFQPSQGRSRRGSRDGGGSSGGGGAPAAAALEAAVAAAAAARVAEQQKRHMSPVPEEAPAAAAEVIQEAFPTVTEAEDDEQQPPAVHGAPGMLDDTGAAAAAAAAAADEAVAATAIAAAASEDPTSPAAAAHQRHQQSSAVAACKKARVSGSGGGSSKTGQGQRR